MIITDKDKSDVKRMQKANIDWTISKSSTIIIIPNPNMSFEVSHVINNILNNQLENPKNIKIFVLNYKQCNEKTINDNKIFKRVELIKTNKIYKEASDLIKNNKEEKIIWLNPNVIIPPDFINKMRNVAKKSILRPLHWYTNENKHYESWENVLSNIENFIGIDGVYTWAMNKEDFLFVDNLMDGKKIDWNKFLYKIKKANINNLYFNDRVLIKNNSKFINIEEY